MTTNFDTAEILQSQVALLERLQSQATRTMLSQATISKRQLLNFVANVDEFVKDFMALNQRTINIIKGVPTDENTVAEGATPAADRPSNSDAGAGAAVGLCEDNNQLDLFRDVGSEAGLQTNDAGSERLHTGSDNG